MNDLNTCSGSVYIQGEPSPLHMFSFGYTTEISYLSLTYIWDADEGARRERATVRRTV